MKRFERYAAQLELLSEAAFVVVRRDGPDALSRRGLAAELGASDAMARRTLGDHVSLPTLAAAACERRRKRACFRFPLVDRVLPDADGVDTEVVWLLLRLRHGTVPALEHGDDLGERYQVATRGRVDVPAVSGDTHGNGSGNGGDTRGDGDGAGGGDRAGDRNRHGDGDGDGDEGGGTEARTPEQQALASYLADHEASTEALVARLVGERAHLVAPVLAMVDGLVLAVCTGRLTPPAARAVLVEHLTTLGVDPTGAPPAPPPP